MNQRIHWRQGAGIYPKSAQTQQGLEIVWGTRRTCSKEGKQQHDMATFEPDKGGETESNCITDVFK